MIKENILKFQTRKNIPTYSKEIKMDQSNLVNSKKKKLYDFYKCDYCNDEIRLDKKESERTGGIIDIPHGITKSGKVRLVLCNKCLKKVLKEFQ